MIVQKIVTDAIYLSLQDREHQPTVNPIYVEVGLEKLNYIIDEWRDRVPFPSVMTFNNFENLENTTFSQINSVNFVINSVSFPVIEKSLEEFKRLQVILNLFGFPKYFKFDELTQSIEIYPKPNNPTYQFTVWGRILSLNLGEFDEVPASWPLFLRNAFIHELAFRLAAEYGQEWDAKKETVRQGLLQGLSDKKNDDLTPDRDIVFGFPGGTGKNPPFPYFYFLSGGT